VVMQIDRPNDKAPNIGEVQARLCNEIIRFEKDIMGRGPEEVKAYIIDDMIILRLKGVLTRAEMNLLEHGEGEKEMALIKEFRQKLIEKNRHHLDEIIMEVTGCNIRSIHTDLSTRTGERVIIFVVY
jgi:uncharacterized protein YbcI